MIVLRPDQKTLEASFAHNPLFPLVELFSIHGIKHLEIAWSPNPVWPSLMKELQRRFPTILWGAASVTSKKALDIVSKLGLPYAMSPIWDHAVQVEAIQLDQLLIPGVTSVSDIKAAQNLGYRLIKIFPASSLGIEYLKQLSSQISSLPFVIAAGGLRISDINQWLNAGYGAIAVGRELFIEKQLDPDCLAWLGKNASQSQSPGDILGTK